MPLWRFYTPPNAFTAEDKQAISEALSDLYGRAMPRFYVGVVFQEVAETDIYIGGKPQTNFVRIAVEHIARTLDSAEAMRGFMMRLNKVLGPWIVDRGFDWEIHVNETPFDLWTVQGYPPPRQGTEDEARWMKENKASPRTHD